MGGRSILQSNDKSEQVVDQRCFCPYAPSSIRRAFFRAQLHPFIFFRSIMSDLYESIVEATAHEGAIASLIGETQLPERIVGSAYEHQLVRLKPGARVNDYLLLFAVRRIREALRSTRT